MSLTPRLILKIVFLGVLDVLALFLALSFFQSPNQIVNILALGILGFVLLTNIAFLSEKLFPWRWILPAMAGVGLLVLFPIGYSVYVSFTNYGDGHILSKQQVIDQFTKQQFFSPEGAASYTLYVYNKEGVRDLLLLLINDEGREFIYAEGDEAIRPLDETGVPLGERDEKNLPVTIDGFSLAAIAPYGERLQATIINADPNIIRVTRVSLLGGNAQAEEQLALYAYDPVADTLTNQQTGQVYQSVRGNFIATIDGVETRLEPGFPEFIGTENFTRAFTDPNIREPFFRVFLWTVVFAAGSVITTFALGMFFAILLNTKNLPFKTLYRILLIFPYAVPGWLLVVTWRSLMNPSYGHFNTTILGFLETSPNWFADPTLMKIAILLVNLHLGFPYMMLITLGALQSIPDDIYEAALIDGASGTQQFRFITLPLLLVALAPLLVASFSYNFNNFTLIELLNNGGPSMGAGSVAGHTDILLSYTYRLAFSGARGIDYGFAAAIGIFIFAIIGPITYFNFRLTKRLEELAA